MAGSTSNSSVMVSAGLVVLGIIIAAIGGITHGSILGGIVAGSGAIPACYGMWKGIQAETQGPLAMAVGSVLVCLGVGAILIILKLVHWVA